MVFIGYFEAIDSQRGIAWRCEDSLSLRKFLGYAPHVETPDHSSLSRIRWRLPKEVFDEVFQFVLRIVDEHKLLDAQSVGVDSTTLEANAAMKSIVRKDNGDDRKEYLTRLAAEDGVEIKSQAELIRYDKQRNKDGQKKVSNDDWTSPGDPDARIAKMKDGTTHLAYKAEHVVDLKTDVILSAEIYHADEADNATLPESLTKAQDHLEQAEIYRDIEKVAADKGYHKAETLARCEELGIRGITPYIPEKGEPVPERLDRQARRARSGRAVESTADATQVRQTTAEAAQRSGGTDVCSPLRNGRRPTQLAARDRERRQALRVAGGRTQSGNRPAKTAGIRQTAGVRGNLCTDCGNLGNFPATQASLGLNGASREVQQSCRRQLSYAGPRFSWPPVRRQSSTGC